MTSTPGWRTLDQYKPLTWLDDIDKDGQAEVVIWDSFPLRAGASLSDYGLVAWVYQTTGDSFALNLDMTRRVAKEIAAAYRLPLQHMSAELGRQRRAAAEALGQFADGRCAVGKTDAR